MDAKYTWVQPDANTLKLARCAGKRQTNRNCGWYNLVTALRKSTSALAWKPVLRTKQVWLLPPGLSPIRKLGVELRAMSIPPGDQQLKLDGLAGAGNVRPAPTREAAA
jgi:hypothetical protein